MASTLISTMAHKQFNVIETETYGYGSLAGRKGLAPRDYGYGETLNIKLGNSCFQRGMVKSITIIKSNLKKAYEMISDNNPINFRLKKLIDTVRYRFEKACQGMHDKFQRINKWQSKYAFRLETLLDILIELDEVNTSTVKLLQTVKDATDSCKQLSSKYGPYFDRFIDRIMALNPIIRGTRDQIFKKNLLMQSLQTNLLNYDIISIIFALLLFMWQSTLASATDMKQLMIFAIVIHLIISGDVETNPGPQFDARDLLKKEPKTCDLLRIFVRSEAARYWKTIGRALEVEVNDLIDGPYHTENNLGLVFDRWIQKYKDVTWNKIIQVCEDYEYGKVHYVISKFLSTPEAHRKYGSEADFDCTDIDIVYRKNENGYSNETDHGLLIILIAIIIVLCSVIYQTWTDCKC